MLLLVTLFHCVGTGAVGDFVFIVLVQVLLVTLRPQLKVMFTHPLKVSLGTAKIAGPLR